MTLVKNGQAIARVIENGQVIDSHLYKLGNRIELGGNVSGTLFTYARAGIQFSVSLNGTVSLSAALGTIETATYTDGQVLGGVTADTVRTNNISVRVPSGWDNTGQLVTGTSTATQQGIGLATVTTLQAEDVTQTSATLRANVEDTGGANLTSSGFYWYEGSLTSINSLISFGILLVDGHNTIGQYMESIGGLTPNSTVTYVAYVTNDAGTSYGGIRTLTTQQAPAVATWLLGATGPFSGGTISSTTFGNFGEWTGAANIDSQTNPTEAECAADQEFCTITRERTQTDTYTNGTRQEDYTCSITQAGTGSPNCPAGIPDSELPVGDPGDVETVTGTGQYQAMSIDTETRQVENVSFEFRTDFSDANIEVTNCSINAVGNGGFVSTNFGTATITNLGSITPNPTAETRLVTVNFTVGISQDEIEGTGIFAGETPLDELFLFEEVPYNSSQLTVMCEQAGQVIVAPVFTTGSATVTTVGNTGNVDDGEFFVIDGSGGTYNVSAPSGTGGNVVRNPDAVEGPFGGMVFGSGAGSFVLNAGDTNTHSFSISNSEGTATYTFYVEASI